MEELDIKSMQSIQGGGAVDSFCTGFGAVASVYGVGVLANWWNPPGQAAIVAGAIIGLGCAAYSLW